MWVVVTAKVSDTKTRPMRINMDYVASYGPAESAPCMVIGSDGSAYPIAETPEQLDGIIEIRQPNPPPAPIEITLTTDKTVVVKPTKRKK